MAFEFRGLRAVMAIAALSVAVASCTSAPRGDAASTVNAGADRSDVYPDITAPVKAATEQMSDEQAESFSAQLTSLSSRRRSGAISEAEYRRRLAELNALGQNHGRDTLAVIEGEN